MSKQNNGGSPSKTKASKTDAKLAKSKVGKLKENFKTEVIYSLWTESEKSKLASTLRKHGLDDIKFLSDEVGTKTPEQVSFFIQTREEAAKRTTVFTGNGKNTGCAPIEIWLQTAQKKLGMEKATDFSKVFAEALSDPFLPGEKTELDIKDVGKVDLKNIYRCLGCLLNGQLVVDPTPAESYVLLMLVRDLAALIKALPMDDIGNFLQKYVPGSIDQELETDVDVEVTSDAFRQTMFDEFSFNPLDLPNSITEKPLRYIAAMKRGNTNRLDSATGSASKPKSSKKK